MAGAWDNLKQTFADAKERRQNTSFGERLAVGLGRGFGVGSNAYDASRGMKPPGHEEGQELPSAWGRLMEVYQQGEDTTGAVGAPWKERQNAPATAEAEYIKQGLVSRGLPEHVAEGFVWNMQDESGLDPGINERNPIVEGSRGGYGLYQLTGPRRRAYEKVATEKGRDFNDIDLQLDFLVNELKTTEKRAGSLLSKTSTPQEAAAVIVEDFLRPSKEHMVRRRDKYLQGGMSTPAAEPAPLITSWNDLL